MSWRRGRDRDGDEIRDKEANEGQDSEPTKRG